MLDFKPILVDSIEEINRFLSYKEYRTCDSTIGALFMWREYYASEYAICNEMLFMKVKFTNNETCFTIPFGKNTLESALDILVDYSSKQNIPLQFCAVPEEAIETLKVYFNNNIDYSFDRDWSDYIYLAKDLSELKGRKYSGQRNHINKFIKIYPNYQYVNINSDNIKQVIEFYNEYSKNMTKTSDTAIEDNKKTKDLLQYLIEFNLIGGYVQVDGNIIAFSIGEIINDTLYVHVEKALKEFPGSFQMIMNEFAKTSVTDSVIYINREEDTGDLGLRTSKLSYHPHQLLDKYLVTCNV